MPISKYAVEKYVKRKVDNHDWMKKLKIEEVNEELTSFNWCFHTPPFLHQKVCFLIGIAYPEFLWMLDMGTGKTKIMLDLIRYYREIGKFKRALVLVPNVANIQNWCDEIDIHQPTLSYTAMDGTTEKRWELLSREVDINIINYAGLLYLGTKKGFKLVGPKDKKRRVPCRVIDPEALAALAEIFDTLILDESTAIGNHASLTTKIIEKLTPYYEFKWAATGTPFGRDPTPLLTQFRAIDNGETLGTTLGMFRAAFFNTKKNYWGGYEHKFDKRKERGLHRLLKHRSIWYDESECGDLPKKVYRLRKVSFPEDQQTYYERILKDIRGGDSTTNLLFKNNFIKMRQIASGFLNHKDLDTGKQTLIKFRKNPKLDELELIIDEINPTRKMVIFYEFTKSGEYITALLKKKKIKHVWLYGGTKDAAAIVTQFKLDPETTHMVVNNQSGAYGLNFQVANYEVFYESNVRPEIRRQGEKRCHRTGQTRRVFIYDIIVRHSVEEKIQRFLSEGKDLFNALVKGTEKL